MVLCIGTTPTLQRTMTFDRLAIDEVNRATQVAEYASGKAVNVARVLATLGEAASAAGFYGGARGDALLDDLARANIPHDFIRTTHQTRLCTTLIDRGTGTATELVEESPAASPDEWDALIALIDRLIPTATAAVFSGTLAPGAPPDFCARWIGKVPLVIVDARGDPLRRALESRGGRLIAKLNRDELAGTLNEPLDTDAALHDAMRRLTPPEGSLIITLGKAGSLALFAGRLCRVTPPAIRSVSAVGSGDAFTAGLIAGIARGIEHALKLATACGAANALTPHSGHLHRADVDRLIDEVRIQSIE